MLKKSVEEAKLHFNDILYQVEMGNEIVITRYDQPVARISAIKKDIKKELKPLPFEKLAALRASMPQMEIPSVELIRQMRDEEY
jgi:antitoxin (DNA-binding transcriptional repressor) of toxin-antitoxin stability system